MTHKLFVFVYVLCCHRAAMITGEYYIERRLLKMRLALTLLPKKMYICHLPAFIYIIFYFLTSSFEEKLLFMDISHLVVQVLSN